MPKKESSLTRVILIRHGQTVWNDGDRFRGQVDLDLDEVGLKQAEAIACHVKQWSVSQLFSSPLKRARQTARPLADNLDLETRDIVEFNDINYGNWQGRTPGEVAVEQPDLYELWHQRPDQVTFPDGESLGQIRKRSVSALENLIVTYPGETFAIVSHKVVCKILILHSLGLGNEHFWNVEQDNGAVNVIEYKDSGLTPALINHTCHLKGIKTPKTIS